MKKLIIIALVLVAAQVQAQDAITKFFSKYQNDDTFSQVTISSKMFSLFADLEVETPEDKEIVNTINKLKGLRILSKNDTRNARELYKEAFTLIPVKDYEELMTVRDKDADMKFFIKDDGKGKVSELLMVMGSNDDFMILSLFGEIDLKQISRLGRKMDIGGLDKLENMDKKSKQ